jgi:hypothetical protein
VDLAAWIAIACAGVPPLVSLPIVLSFRAAAEHFWAVPHWSGVLDFIDDLLTRSILPVFTLVVLLGIPSLGGWVRLKASEPFRWRRPFRAEDLTLVGSFLALPAVILIAAKFFTHAFAFRYALAGSIGPWLLLPLLFAFSGVRRMAAISFVVLASVYWTAWSIRIVQHELVSRNTLRNMATLLQSRNPRNLPIALVDHDLFMKLSFYGPPKLKRNLVYLTDLRRSLHYLGNFTVDFSATRINPWFRMNLMDYDTFRSTHSDFQVWADTWYDWHWLLRALTDDGIHPVVLTQFEDRLLLEASTSP